MPEEAFALAYEAKKGKIPLAELHGAARRLFESLTEDQLKDYAETGKSKLPDRTAKRTSARGRARY